MLNNVFELGTRTRTRIQGLYRFLFWRVTGAAGMQTRRIAPAEAMDFPSSRMVLVRGSFGRVGHGFLRTLGRFMNMRFEKPKENLIFYG
jgi:hypothetical protein